jgi:Tol biopolymer transport system component
MSTKRLLCLMSLITFATLTACAPQPASSPTPAPIPSPTAVPGLPAGEGPWIAYQTNRGPGGLQAIRLIHPDGTGDYLIATDVTGSKFSPDWSPDGGRLAFATRGGATEPLYEYDLGTNTSRQLFACEDPCLGDEDPAYSPDGTRVVFLRSLGPLVPSDEFGQEVPSDCGLWIGEIATGEVTQITSNTHPACDGEYTPRWSPDGTQLLYWRDPYENGKPIGTAVYVIQADGSSERRLTDPEMFAGEADWSPDGEWIVFATYPFGEFGDAGPKPSNLYRIHPDGSGLEQLTHYEMNLKAVQPQYTPDGKAILFTGAGSSSRSLYTLPAGGSEPTLIARGGVYTHGTWQP